MTTMRRAGSIREIAWKKTKEMRLAYLRTVSDGAEIRPRPGVACRRLAGAARLWWRDLKCHDGRVRRDSAVA